MRVGKVFYIDFKLVKDVNYFLTSCTICVVKTTKPCLTYWLVINKEQNKRTFYSV